MDPFGMDRIPEFPENSTGQEYQKGDQTVGHASKDKTKDVKHFLMEPKQENIANGFLGLDKENNESSFKMEEVCLGFDFGIWPNYGGPDCYSALEGEADLKLEILDGFLDEVDEVEDIYASQDLFPISDDFLQDNNETVKVSELNNDPYGAPNSSSESHSPEISGSIGLSESPKETVIQSESQNVSCDKFDISGSTLSESHSLYESEDDKKPLAIFIASQTKLGRDQKKQRNTTRRSDCLGKTISRPTYDFRPRRGNLKKSLPKTENTRSDNEVTTSESEEDFSLSETSKSRRDRRQHQRMWTLAEVVKLVDGISQFGVGKWTNIKNLFFQSAAHRTPIDLRDKWRNLLRASYANKHNGGGEVEKEPRSHARPLPKHILHRVRELATLHPYPYLKSSTFVSDSSLAQPSVNARTRGTLRKKKRC